jgi:hypothetical protein
MYRLVMTHNVGYCLSFVFRSFPFLRTDVPSSHYRSSFAFEGLWHAYLSAQLDYRRGFWQDTLVNSDDNSRRKQRNSTDTKNFRPSWAEHAQLLSLPLSFSLALEKSFDRLIRYSWIDQYSNTSLYQGDLDRFRLWP